MSRSIFISLACVSLAVAPFAVACDKTGAEAQAQANEAQNKANTQVANANSEANQKIAQAQSEADKKIAAAQGDFAKTREDYRHLVQSNLDALNKEIGDLDAKAATSKKPDLRAALPSLKSQRDAFVADFNSLGNASAVTWDGTKARLDKEWSDLKAAVDKAG
jgi:regulator of protease activity HflC (stomatin/prohibitin superfamily)